VPRHRTLWEEGRHPGRLVAQAAAAALVVVVLLNLLVTERLGLAFDVVFVLVCVCAALAVRPRDFFAVGVLPPLLLLAVVGGLALGDRSAVADPEDGLVQAVVSGLAHHAGALVVGYGLTLAVLALRQVALRNHGVLRVPQQRPATPVPPMPAQRPRSRVP
jgi:hypothetical protein